MDEEEQISARAFEHLTKLFREHSGIHLPAEKKALVAARLRKRVNALGVSGFDEYCQYLTRRDNGEELRRFVDLLTTNETYFFREPQHFAELAKQIGTRFARRSFRVWSAACSSGEEPYSIAMTLLDRRPAGDWELYASDLSTRVLECAQLGVFPMQRLELLPAGYLQRFCLRGKGEYTGKMRVGEDVRKRVQFFQHNLLDDSRAHGIFDVIFLRNVLIYFEL
ncbi:MAG TPA: protein-glutamate O-methyltransferase CheR, partial [Polyangiales bacterium]|nr:protein-glutamate O-methyltransferase CheR [Polyangiales bacterium]